MNNQEYKQFNCYTILLIPPVATPSEIKTAYKKISLKTHPDVGGSTTEQTKVNIAYAILSDPIQRQAHDFFWTKSLENKVSDIAPPKPHKKSQTAPSTTPPSKSESSNGAALSAFKRRMEQTIQAKKERLWANIDSLTQQKYEEFLKKYFQERKSFAYITIGAIISGVIAPQVSFFWLPCIWLGIISLSQLGGIDIQQKKFSVLSINIERDIKTHAKLVATKQAQDEASALDRFMGDFASIIELALRSSSYDDSEIHVVRRITVALFIMGYNPMSYDSENRILLFKDGDEKIVVRFRHRTGSPLNISYVEKLQQLLTSNQTTHGFLFCSPGLSGNAAMYAKNNGIKWYTLESMNVWINQILHSNYSGPSGDILENLNTFNHFLSGITPKVGRSRARGRRYRSRYRY